MTPAAAADRLAAFLAPGPFRLVIDGRSGAGKTTLARAVATARGARLVSLDEFYPGWGGLARATPVAARILTDHAAGRAATYRRWDWARGEYETRERRVDPGEPLVVEGCGSLSPAAARAATCAVWLDADAHARRDRALARDGDGFRPFWDMWAAQEDAHILDHAPESLATFAWCMA
ncbi:hypothetical protein [Microbacterium excoecariae]|uniref:hypothetical protein n=1 Tax=Microbacterium excoecariae TaxID=2715210 RepID=UPI00140E852C|nr:hypothetical protein [Microbacterium excoecariae]